MKAFSQAVPTVLMSHLVTVYVKGLSEQYVCMYMLSNGEIINLLNVE